ncbi:MAG: hypothetical protein AAGG56_17085 [Pseudomonadota bacterium]
MLALIAVGGVLAAAGVWLMLRETAAGEPARIAMGSLQIQSASIGFTAFLTGASVFTAPLVAPETTEAVVERVVNTLERTLIRKEPEAIRRARDPATPDMVQAADPEPENNAVEGAYPIHEGMIAGGAHSGLDPDWFKLVTDGENITRITVEISQRVHDCYAHLYDSQQYYLGLVDLVPGRNRFTLDVNASDGFLLQLNCTREGISAPYSLMFLASREPPTEEAPQED